MTPTQPVTRRVKAFAVPEHAVLDLFLMGSVLQMRPEGFCFCVHALDTSPLPDGCKVLSVHHDWHSRAFLFMVEHPSFDEVPDGAMTPDVPFGEMLYHAVHVKWEPDADQPVTAGGGA